ncbi:uncharacterized protein PV07_03321 [Cladophialophora immunda]|uniref:Metallo-beta-lactamase domain-containing protein n=1 Tax=Cladophialophora immunda TaxID=569365 RepID=A0A0D1ZUC2_9EURO|nr:uncharacterized protein PV07_03321 [Cladophialophora immunda]KIW31721.1 hypothetical protein PV07_03321 [Cladophialophora immunda]
MANEIQPEPLSPWQLPTGNAIVKVRAINTTTDMQLASIGFFEPVIPGLETFSLTTLAFLLEHPNSGKKILFDAGSRKDFWNFPPVVYGLLLEAAVGLKVEKNVSEILEEKGIDLRQINAVVWSHWHWDHSGDMSQFPASTEVVVGPGFKESFMPGYPTNPKAMMLDSDFEGREVREISFSDDHIGPYESYDFWGDGSLFLLNVPGHAVGHIGALARTTPDTWVFLGGDVCHFNGVFRPSIYQPMPAEIPEEALVNSPFIPPCPCSVFTSIHPDPEHARTKPFHSIATGKIAPTITADPATAQLSVQKMLEYDAHPNIFVCISHDRALIDELPLFNDSPESDINDWKEAGYKTNTFWRFLGYLPKDGKQTRPHLVTGVWREGKLVDVPS